jgi:tetratricopeptide (TPR) repeat protein
MKICTQCDAEMDNEETVCPQCGFQKKPLGVFRRLFGLGPKSPSDHLDQGNAYFNRRSPDGYVGQGDLSRAIDAYTKAIKLDSKLASAYQPKLAKLYQYRGDAFLRQNDVDRAINDYTEAIRLLPRLPWPTITGRWPTLGRGLWTRRSLIATKRFGSSPTTFPLISAGPSALCKKEM